MSGRLNHSVSTVENLPSNMTQNKSGQTALSSLKRFGQAKSKINSIYEEILSYGCEVAKFLQSFKGTFIQYNLIFTHNNFYLNGLISCL